MGDLSESLALEGTSYRGRLPSPIKGPGQVENSADFRWKLDEAGAVSSAVSAPSTETPRTARPPVWRSSNKQVVVPDEASKDGQGSNAAVASAGAASPWLVTATLQFSDKAPGAVGGDGSMHARNFPGKAGRMHTPRGLRPKTAATPGLRRSRASGDEENVGNWARESEGRVSSKKTSPVRSESPGKRGIARSFIQKLPGGGFTGPNRPQSAPHARSGAGSSPRRPMTARSAHQHSPRLPDSVPEHVEREASFTDGRVYAGQGTQSSDVVADRIAALMGLNGEDQGLESAATPGLATLVPRLVLISNHTAKAADSPRRRPLSARGVDLGYGSRRRKQDAMLEKMTARNKVALLFADSDPRDLHKPGSGPGGGTPRISSGQLAWDEAKKIDLSFVFGHKDRSKFSAEGHQKDNDDVEVGLAPQPPVNLPIQLYDLSLTAKLSRAKDEHKADQPAGISARRAGYNPLLRKYEQKMPRDVALYLALNAKDKSVVADKHEAVVPDKSVVPNPPTKSKKTSKTPRKSMQAAFKTATAGGTGAGSGAGPGAGVKAQRGEEVERSGQPFISPRIAQLSVAKVRAPDRDEPRQAIEWSLPLSCRRKNDETKAVDWVARNATRGSGETAREGKGSVRSQERNGWAEKARECRESVSRAEDAKRVRVLAVMERHGLSMPESLEQKRIREIAEKKIAEKQKGWTALMVAFKFYTSAAYIIKSTQGIESQKPRGKRKGSMSSTFMVSAFVRNLEHKTRERKKITGPLAKYADKPSFRCCIMSIRWFFDTRKSIWKNFSLAVKKVLRRFLVRYYLRKQYKFFEKQSMIVRGVFEQSKHSYKIRGYVQRYIKSVIRCQRIVRASYIRSKKRAELVADAFEDFEAVFLLKEIVREIHAQHGDHGAASKQQHGQQAGLREAQMSTLKLQFSKLTPDQMLQYDRRVAGIKGWVAMGLDKVAQELVRVITANNVHISAKGADPFAAMVTLFMDAKLPGEVRGRMYVEMQYALESKHSRSLFNFMAEREKAVQMNQKEQTIRDALAFWSPNLPNLYDKEVRRSDSGGKVVMRPRWLPKAILDERSAAEWMSIGSQMRVSEAQKVGALAPLGVKGLLKVASEAIVSSQERGGALAGFGATFLAAKTLSKALDKRRPSVNS